MNKTIFKTLYPIYAKLRNFYYFISGRPRAIGFIFMLHRVGEHNSKNLFANENMKISPTYLDDFIKSIKKKYDIIRLEDVAQKMKIKSGRPFVVFTMDDGYKDNLYHALPIFKKHNSPYTIFITSNFPDKKAILWWYIVEDLILNNEEIHLSDGSIFSAKNSHEKEECFMAIRKKILKLNQQNLRNELEDLFSSYNIDWYSKCDEMCLSWNEIKILKQEPLVTLGAHTQNHYNLKKLNSKDEVKNEVISGYNRLYQEQKIHSKVFAYPFGTYNEASEREFEALSELSDKFILSVRACGGPIPKGYDNIHSLPRIMLEEGKSFMNLVLSKGVYV